MQSPALSPSHSLEPSSSTCSVATLKTFSEPIHGHDASSVEKDKPEPASIRSLDTCSSETLDEFGPTCPQLSTLRLLAAHIGAALTLFLATTDATIVSTSLPTIASEMRMSQDEYGWVGIAYMLTQTALQPLYGRISDLVGRKNVPMLLAARAVAGSGAGGIVGSVWVITAEIVAVRDRAKWSQALSVTWSCSAVAGPLLGGLFSGSTGVLNWRFGFYLNLPVGCFGFAVIALALRGVPLSKAPNASWDSFLRTFDFLGLVLFMIGSSFIVVGFSLASQNGCKPSRHTRDLHYKFDRVVPLDSVVHLLWTGHAPAAFSDLRTSAPPFLLFAFPSSTALVIILWITFFHNVAFTAGTFYLALFYQAANDSTPLEAGYKLLPYSLGGSLASMPAAWFMDYWQRRTQTSNGQRWVVSVGLLIATVGFGLLNLLNERSTIIAEVVPLVAGIGIGMLFHAPYQVFIQTLKRRDLAAGTSAFFLVRFTGSTVGLAIAGAIFDARAYARLPSDLLERGGTSLDFSRLRDLQPQTYKLEILHIIATSIQTVWTFCTPCLGVSLLLSLLLLWGRRPESVIQTDEKSAESGNP
ncbi:unnamed protein product [Mycena citricolor]|uniref:Major facilitator superfamily (MFS) profile domain-containing protein n=1 Tax=Mycena citricolor TaxID=2018698 RepID=A0AAD2GYN8_9AGAR|nr:unnamed protein product [Mycena citricolor]